MGIQGADETEQRGGEPLIGGIWKRANSWIEKEDQEASTWEDTSTSSRIRTDQTSSLKKSSNGFTLRKVERIENPMAELKIPRKRHRKNKERDVRGSDKRGRG